MSNEPELKPKHHDLKCDPMPFHAARLGRKLSELRLNDRDYQSGDTVTLHEYQRGPDEGYTGDKGGPFTIGHILRGGYGLPKGYVMFSLLRPSPAAEPPPLSEEALGALARVDGAAAHLMPAGMQLLHRDAAILARALRGLHPEGGAT